MKVPFASQRFQCRFRFHSHHHHYNMNKHNILFLCMMCFEYIYRHTIQRETNQCVCCGASLAPSLSSRHHWNHNRNKEKLWKIFECFNACACTKMTTRLYILRPAGPRANIFLLFCLFFCICCVWSTVYGRCTMLLWAWCIVTHTHTHKKWFLSIAVLWFFLKIGRRIHQHYMYASTIQ